MKNNFSYYYNNAFCLSSFRTEIIHYTIISYCLEIVHSHSKYNIK